MLSKCYYQPWVHFLGISCNTWNLPQEAELMSQLVHTVNDYNVETWGSCKVFLLSIAYLHITCSLGIQPMVHITPTALVLYGTHLIIVSCIIVKNCPVIQKNVSSSSHWLHMKTQLATVQDFTSNVLQNCAELQKLREVHLPPVEFHRTQLRKVRDFTCSALQNREELKEFWKFASSSLWNSTSPKSQM